MSARSFGAAITLASDAHPRQTHKPSRLYIETPRRHLRGEHEQMTAVRHEALGVLTHGVPTSARRRKDIHVAKLEKRGWRAGRFSLNTRASCAGAELGGSQEAAWQGNFRRDRC